MNNLEVFNNLEFGNVRAAEIDGKLHAVGVDVARALDYANPSKAIIDHCKGDFLTWEVIDSLGRMQNTRIISEGDIYRLIIKAADQSHSPEIKTKAARFEKWIFEEVLPSIRRHGAYLTVDKARELMNDPDAWISLISALKKEKIKNECLQAQIEEDRPKVTFANAVTASDKSTITVGELAKILKSNKVDIGQNRLYEKLRREGFIIRNGLSRHNVPTQEALNRGLFAFNKITYTEDDGSIVFSYAPKVTAKGQRYFVNYFLSQKRSENADD